MNKRILEIAEQAGVLADFGEDIKMGRYSIGGTNQSMEKFAELIVRECAKEAFNFWCYQDDSNDESAQSHIKKHFGIEE